MAVTNVGYRSVSPMPAVDTRGQTFRSQNTQSEAKSKPQIQSTAAELQRVSHALNKKLQFVVDHGSNEVIVKVIDKDTDKVIKVIPPEELQRLHKNLKEAIGLLLDEMV